MTCPHCGRYFQTLEDEANDGHPCPYCLADPDDDTAEEEE